MPHVPPPPHADGIKILFEDNVDSRVEPGSVSSSFSSLMVILTFPWGINFVLAKISTQTKRRVISRKIPILKPITTPISTCSKVILYYVFIYYYNLIPKKLINAIPIKPVIMNVMPRPRRAGGTLEYLIFSLMAAIPTMARNQPTPEPSPKDVA